MKLKKKFFIVIYIKFRWGNGHFFSKIFCHSRAITFWKFRFYEYQKPYSFFKMSANSLTSLTDKFTNCSAKVFKSAIFLFLFYFYYYLFDNVWRIPESFPPLDESAEITFLAGDCNNIIMSPINSSLDLIANNVSSWSSPM